MFTILTSIQPTEIHAFSKQEAELKVEVGNLSDDYVWCEVDISLPPTLSLAPHQQLQKGRIRIGIIQPGQSNIKDCKIYSSSNTFADVHEINITAYIFNKKGVIEERLEAKQQLKAVEK
ncbi:MAG: hypothetical protein ACP5HJ_02610 [Candidatus Micrarchaeia archaeon]|jgi:hypothetical protein